MQRRVATLLTTGLIASGIALAAPPAQAASGGALLYGLTSANHLVSFRELSPGTALTDVAITGLGSDTLVGLDVRPKTGLIALGSSGRLYAVDATTGAATATTGTPPTLNGTAFGFDVNPTVDRVRVVSDSGQNLRLNPDTGAVAATDTSLAYAAGDPKAGTTPVVTAAAYTNSVNGATATTLYDIDVAQDVLAIQNPPNNGTLNTVGGLLVDATGSAGFDIDAATNRAFAVLTVGGADGFYSIDLGTGQATLVGSALSGLVDVTAAPVARPAYLLLTDNTLVTLDLSTPATAAAPVTITGVAADVVGIDVRPATGALYALTADSKLYTVNPATGAATLASTLSTALSGAAFGVDFNPVPDRLRIVSDTGQNLRVNVDTGAVTTDTALNGATASVVGAGYTNSFAGAGSTTLYDLSAATDTLYVQNPPNNGTTTAVGTGLGVDINNGSDLDIAPEGNVAYGLLTAAAPGLYRINLTTGTATLIGTVNTLAEDLALASPGRLTAANVATDEAQSTATVTVTRTGGSAGVVGVDYATSGGTATAGSDYTATSGTLRFADGETSKTFTVPLLQDTLTEGPETIGITFGNELGAPPVAPVTVTVADDEPAIGYALTSDNKLGTFALGTPGTFTNLVAISGVTADVVGIDVRPATGALYALTLDNKLYTVDPATGAATLASTLSAPLSGTAFGVDFNPVPDRLRIVSDTGQNLRVNVDTGAVTTDAALNGATTSVIGAGYTNSAAGSTTTTLYDVSAASDTLYIQNPPNNGTTTAVGTGLGLDISAAGDLDIVPNGNAAFGAFTVGGVASLYRVDLTAGTATSIAAFQAADVEDLALPGNGRLTAASVTVAESAATATVTVTRTAGSQGAVSVDYATGSGTATAGADYTATSGTLAFADGETSKTVVITLADDSFVEGTETVPVVFSNPKGGIGPVAAATVTLTDGETGKAYGLTSDDKVVVLDPTAPGTAATSSKAIGGLGSGEDVVGIDVRPANGKLYALTSTGRVLVVDPATGDTQAVSTLTTVPTGVVSIDFNPVVDRLRVVSSTGQNLRVNVETGATTVDTALAYATGDAGAGTTPAVAAIAHTNSAPGASATTLFDVESARDVLTTQAPPNNGSLNTVGALGVDVSTTVGLDIGFPGNSAFLVQGGSLYRVETSTGVTGSLGTLATPVEDLALAQAPVAQAGRYHPLAPARVYDTRTDGTPVRAGFDRTVVVAGKAGVPATGVSAVVLNVTMTRGTIAQNLAVFPTGQKPSNRTSNLNAAARQTVAVEVQTGLGTGGAIDLSVSAGNAEVIVDVVGWYGDATDTGGVGYQPLTPSRLLDTRTTPTPLYVGAVRNQQVAGLAGVPAGAKAVAVNLTVTKASAPLHVQLSPGGTAAPATSTINVVPGQTVANAAVVTLGADGSIDLRASAGRVDAIVDVVGYYGDTAGARFVPLAPSRLLDTRTTGTRLTAGTPTVLAVGGAGGVPATATAAVLSVTGTQATGRSFVTTTPTGSNPGTQTSTINLAPRLDVANVAVSGLGTGGAVSFTVSTADTHLVVDVTGYFTQP